MLFIKKTVAIVLILCVLSACATAEKAEHSDPIGSAQPETAAPDDAEPAHSETTPTQPEPEPAQTQTEPEKSDIAADKTDPEAQEQGKPETPMQENSPTQTVPVTGLKVSIASNPAYLTPGEKYTAKAHVEPANATNPRVSWSSSSGLIDVDADGTLRVSRAKRLPDDGQYVDIWAKASDGSYCMNCTTVLVLPNATRLTILGGDLDMPARPGETVRLQASVEPSSLRGRVSIVWDSSNPRVATVDDGVVRLTGYPGKTAITATAADGAQRGDTVQISVHSVSQSVLIVAPTAIARGGIARLNAQAVDAIGDVMHGVSVSWAVTPAVPGADIAHDGTLRIDPYCAAGSVIVRATARDTGAAVAYERVLITASDGVLSDRLRDVPPGSDR